MSGGIPSWDIEDNSAEEEEERRWYRRLVEGRRVLTPGGKHLTEAAAQEYATDTRYLFFADWVNPLQWQVAAQLNKHTLRKVTSLLLDSGPDPVLITRTYPGMLVSEWQTKVIECYTAALEDGDVVFDEGPAFTHSEEVRREQERIAAYNDPFDFDAPEPIGDEEPEDRPATPRADTASFLQKTGITRHSEGNPNRVSRTPEYRRRKRRIKRQAIGRAKETQE